MGLKDSEELCIIVIVQIELRNRQEIKTKTEAVRIGIREGCETERSFSIKIFWDRLYRKLSVCPTLQQQIYRNLELMTESERTG